MGAILYSTRSFCCMAPGNTSSPAASFLSWSLVGGNTGKAVLTEKRCGSHTECLCSRRRDVVNDDVIKVLLVEDDEDDYILIRELLANVRRTKYVLEWVPTYEQAVEKMAAGANQVYLLDYRLGARNGIDILKGMQGPGYSTPMILVTGHEDYDVDFEAMRLGATDYLVKSQLN